MSYQVLARKWRPQSFDTMVGQRHVLKALSNALEQGRLHHAYLLTGTRGVGKTTIARILARCLNCEKGVTSQPCGDCSSCCEISEGRSFDLIEVDAASRTKIDDMRELLDNVQYAPSKSRYKIYLIDEVHMLSNSSFNALLKTLEEPPPHVVFLFATTHPQKIPPTVLSRCLQFHLKNLSVDIIVEHLKTLFEKESVDFEEAALLAIANAAAGSMRDALSLSDQAIAFGSGAVTELGVNAMLGTVDQQILADLLSAVVAGDAEAALAVVAGYAETAPDYVGLIDRLLALLHRIAVEQAAPAAGAEGQLQRKFIQQYAAKIAPEDLQLYYQSLLVGKRDLPLAPDPLTGLEMLVLRLLAFQLATEGDLPVGGAASGKAASTKKPRSERPAGLEPAASGAVGGEPSATGNREPPAVFNKEPSENASASPVARMRQQLEAGPVAQVAAESDESSTEVLAHGSESFSVSVPIKADVAAVEMESVVPVDGSQVSALKTNEACDNSLSPEHITEDKWRDIFFTLPLSGIVRTVASHCLPLPSQAGSEKAAAGSLVFALRKEDATLFDAEHAERLAVGLTIFCAQPVAVEMVLVDCWADIGLAEGAETPAAQRARIKGERQDAALSSLSEDENVQALVEAFDGEIDPESVRSLRSS